MDAVKVRDAIKLVEEDGWIHIRTHGSHRPIAGHPGVDIPKGTMNSILKQAGLKN